MHRLNKLWRLLATGLCFAVFGLGGLLLAIFWLPGYRLRYTSEDERQCASRYAVHRGFRFFVNLMELTGVVKTHGIELDKLCQMEGKIIIANHPSLIDVVVLISYIPNANCVVKQSLWDNPFIRGVLRNTGYLSNADPEGMVEQCKKTLEEGNNLIIFPEGTRTKPGEQPMFQRGAANLAIRTGKNFQIVLIDVSPPGLTKGWPWYKVPENKMVMTLEVKHEFDITPYLEGKISKSVRGLTRDIQAVFIEELQNSELTQRT